MVRTLDEGTRMTPELVQRIAARLLAVFLGLGCLLTLAWYMGGKRIAENFVRKKTQPWAVFQVPENPASLDGLDVMLAANNVTLCNRTEGNWNKVLVQI